jgi:hypothetical protein
MRLFIVSLDRPTSRLLRCRPLVGLYRSTAALATPLP